MAKKLKANILPILIAFVWLLFSAPFFFSDKTPFPSDYQVNFFSPWNSYPGMGGPVKNNAQPDIIGQIYPWRYFTISEIKQGRIPFWNPYSFAGTPHLANYQSAVLFPMNILFFMPIQFIDAWSMLVLLQPLFAGLFMCLLTRKLGISKWGSAISSLSFMFCGFIVTWMGYATLGYAILFLPLAYYSIISFSKSRKYRWLILLSATFPLSFFAGHFQTSLYFAIGVFFFIIYQLVFSRERKLYFDALVFALIGLLLSMPQIIPSIEFYSHSFRSGLFQKMEAIPFQYLPTLFSPDFFGNPVTRNDWFGHYAEWNGYTGAVGFSFAIFTLLYNRTRITFFFILLCILSLFLAFDSPLLNLLVFLKIPVLSTSAASRIIVLFSFSIAVLAGFGIDSLRENLKNKRKIIVWIVTTIALFSLLSFIGLLPIKEADKILIAQKNSILPLLTLLLLFILVIVLTFLKKRKHLIYIALVIIIFLSSFEMYRFAAKWQNFDPKDFVYVNVPVTNFYNAQNHYDRAIGLSGGEDGVYYRMPLLGGYDPLYKAEYGELVQYIGRGEMAPPERSVVVFPIHGRYTPQAMDYLGVKLVVHKVSDGTFPWAFPFSKYPPEQFSKIYDDARYLVFRNNNSFDRAFLVSKVKKVKRKDIPKFMFENDLRKIAAVENDSPVLEGSSTGSAKILGYLPNSIRIRTISDGSALLVLTDNYYPGWKVTVNGIKSEIIKTNYSFKGVVVPKGESIVEFSYLPMSFLIGVYLFLAGVMIIFIRVFFGSYKSK